MFELLPNEINVKILKDISTKDLWSFAQGSKVNKALAEQELVRRLKHKTLSTEDMLRLVKVSTVSEEDKAKAEQELVPKLKALPIKDILRFAPVSKMADDELLQRLVHFIEEGKANTEEEGTELIKLMEKGSVHRQRTIEEVKRRGKVRLVP